MNCEKCEEKIPAARLLAVPTTRLCRDCKAQSDEAPLTARSMRMRGALVEISAGTCEQERAIEALRR